MMPRSRFSWISTALWVSVCLFAAVMLGDEGPLAQARVRVVDEATREAIAGARVFAEHGGLPTADIGVWHGPRSELRFIERMQRRDLPGEKVDANGGFLFEPNAPGRWLIEAWAEGYVKQWRDVVLGSGPFEAELELRLVRGGAIEGTVTDAEGNPLAGAFVFATPHYDVRVQSTGVAAFTDGEGRYRIAYVPRDRTVFINATASQAGFSTKQEKREKLDAENRIDFSLEQRLPGPTVRGLVVDQNGKPIVGAVIEEDAGGFVEPRRVVTGDDGGFVMEDLEAGRPRLVVQAPGFRLENIKRGAPDDDGSFQATVTLVRGYRAASQVVDDRGHPLAGVEIVFWDVAGDSPRQRLGATISGGDGRFEFDSLPVQCVGTFMKRGYTTINHELTLDNAQPLRVVMSQDRVFKGKVIDATTGEPISSFQVRVQSPSSSVLAHVSSHQFFDRRLIDPGLPVFSRDGAFELSGLPADVSCQMIVDAPGYVRQFSRPVVATRRRDSDHTEIALQADDPARRVHYGGRLVDDAGAPVAGAELRLIVAVPRPTGESMGAIAAARRRGPRGALHRNMSGPGNYVLDPRRVVGGHAANDVQVVRFERALSDEQGRFRFDGVPRTRQIVLAWWKPQIAPGWKKELQELSEQEAGDMQVNVAPPAGVTLRVDRHAISGPLAITVDAKLVTGPTVEIDLPAERDEIEVSDLAEGQYKLVVAAISDLNGRRQKIERARKQFSLGRGEQLEIELTEADLTKRQ